MNFELNEEQLVVQEAARSFAQNQCLPGVIERDTNMTHPTALLKEMGELGFMGMMVNPKYDGGGMDTISYCVAVEELSKIDNSCSVAMSVNNSLVCWGCDGGLECLSNANIFVYTFGWNPVDRRSNHLDDF